MRNKHYKLCYDLSIFKDTLLGDKVLFRCISASVGGIFMKFHTQNFRRMRYKLVNFGCNR